MLPFQTATLDAYAGPLIAEMCWNAVESKEVNDLDQAMVRRRGCATSSYTVVLPGVRMRV